MTVAVEGKVPTLQSTEMAADQTNVKKAKTNEGNMMAELKDLSSYFSQLIDTIPAKVYFAQNSDVLENIEVNKRAVFEDSKLSGKAKNKRIKLDPNAYQKVSDVANALQEKKKTEGKMGELRKKLAKRIKELRAARGATESSKRAKRPTSESSEVNGSNLTNSDSGSMENIPKIYNNKGDLVFSKFDFASHVDIAAEKALEKAKEKKPSLKGLLTKVKKEDEKIAKLEKIDVDAASKLKEKKMWKSALEKAEGNKVKDNAKLLEKSLKQKNKKRVKHAKEWEERKKSVENRMKKRQEKRQRNIEERKQQKKDSKIKYLKKKGRIPS